MIKKLLIANRGEIALRIIRACKELNIKTVAIHSLVDELSLHVRFADEAICIGKNPSTDSYLNVARIISAAEISDVDAIHPGYGFLSESSRFARICEQNKIKFIGPTPELIELLGDKSTAKETMRKAGIPVVPGSDGSVNSEEEAVKIAEEIGFPVIIKASAGGGGKGMRVVHNNAALQNAFVMARMESEKAFGNPEVYIEKYIENPRHIEVQILGDQHGNVVHIGERDCSIQRRHQKLIEETPAPNISEELRNKICDTAAKAAESIGYQNAGTIEFLVENEEFYFMEMNTRLQVEHPVSENISNIDIVKEQIIISSNENLQYKQDDIRFFGHSIECRINAEDPDNNFCPSPGKIVWYHPPGGPGIRVDSHVYQKYNVPPYYDSLIAKLISFGKDRDEAIARMKRALDEYIIGGIKTTIPFHKKILNDYNFHAGNFSTSFLENLNKE